MIAVAMEPADSIGRLGFGRWHERRLIEAHAWFTSAFLCLIAVLACLEELNFRSSTLHAVVNAGMIAAATAMGVYALHRYRQLLGEAMRLSEQATCRKCGAYARFKMISSSQACCRNCDHQWRLIHSE